MNEDEFKGGARYIGGKVEKAVGDAVESRSWQVDGVVDQVAGGIQHGYGRARSILDDAIESAPELAEEARDRLKVAGERAADTAQKSGRIAAETVRDTPVLWAVAAAMGAYALAWFVHGRRA
ncbi:CsbD family protein [Sphingomonadaceae bacterium OTU29THOMA1]|uniref:CsbD family protein n=1 Tax=Sphingomonas sp. Leaf37 TaxID=2876552 RepID=UPI001E5E2AAD|nr:CsbD family protein [Sphingomonas sp. Leaf37]USU06826.1 CsbD family protein [Sphingomonadaceae bacterium OTU29LAMAA1]USU13641.1 CsbD family protein [Sphingomonadaceae bacterium OTU29THOMA1]